VNIQVYYLPDCDAV